MAHSDALIFLTNITWIFILFLFTYFFFVTLVLPTFYKKFRARVLIKNVTFLSALLALRTTFASGIVCLDTLKGSYSILASSFRGSRNLLKQSHAMLFFSKMLLLPSLVAPASLTVSALFKRRSPRLLFVERATNGLIFTQYTKN